MASSQDKSANQEIERVENIAKNLQQQMGVMMTENKKLRNDLKKVITTARSASPMDSALKKSVSMKDEETKEMGRLANVKKVPPRNKKNGFASP